MFNFFCMLVCFVLFFVNSFFTRLYNYTKEQRIRTSATDVTGNEIVDNITNANVSKTSPQNNLEPVTNDFYKEIPPDIKSKVSYDLILI